MQRAWPSKSKIFPRPPPTHTPPHRVVIDVVGAVDVGVYVGVVIVVVVCW